MKKETLEKISEILMKEKLHALIVLSDTKTPAGMLGGNIEEIGSALLSLANENKALAEVLKNVVSCLKDIEEEEESLSQKEEIRTSKQKELSESEKADLLIDEFLKNKK